MGVYTSGPGDWVGEYVDTSISTISTGTGTRVCNLCASDCRWCLYPGATNCLNCKDAYFLMDLYT